MNNSKMHVAHELASQLFVAENALDEAFSQIANLASLMPSARRRINASAALGHSAIGGVMQTLTMLGEARGHLLATHAALAKAQKRIGLEPVNFGAFVDKPTQNTGLSVVTRVAA